MCIYICIFTFVCKHVDIQQSLQCRVCVSNFTYDLICSDNPDYGVAIPSRIKL